MQYDKTFKEETVHLSDEIGLKNAAAQLGISVVVKRFCNIPGSIPKLIYYIPF